MTATITSPLRAKHAGRDVQAVLAVHLLFVIAYVGAAAVAPVPAKGWLVLASVVAYNVVLPLVARAVGRPDWVALWAFLLPLSVFQLWPDWVLADLIGTLRFPTTGGPRADDVIPLVMCGMWVAPLFCALALAAGSAARAALLALVIFAGSELLAPVLSLWEPTGAAHQVAGVALYVLPAEAALGWAAAVAFAASRSRPWPGRVAAALAVSTFYLGALVLAHFVIDVAGWSITL